jgi:hypothetical protein
VADRPLLFRGVLQPGPPVRGRICWLPRVLPAAQCHGAASRSASGGGAQSNCGIVTDYGTGRNQDDTRNALNRHKSGDWGGLEEEDRQANDRALVEGTRILSAYHTGTGLKFWIVTEADRSVTTVLLPEDY